MTFWFRLSIFLSKLDIRQLDRDPGGVLVAEKLTNFNVPSNDPHILGTTEMAVWQVPCGGCGQEGQKREVLQLG